jgi:hypothetical protein
MELGTVSLSPKTDGHAQEITVDNTIPDLVIDSDRGAGTYTAEDSRVDRVILQINGNNGVSIGELIVDGVTAHTGDFQWDWLKAGKLTMDASNEIGSGNGIDLSDANWANTIKARSSSIYRCHSGGLDYSGDVFMAGGWPVVAGNSSLEAGQP